LKAEEEENVEAGASRIIFFGCTRPLSEESAVIAVHVSSGQLYANSFPGQVPTYILSPHRLTTGQYLQNGTTHHDTCDGGRPGEDPEPEL
jgi:hypothetical protein